MLATTQRMTTTGPRSGGSRFFASPSRTWPRAPRSHATRPAHRSASRKLASGFLRSAPTPHARKVAAQAADERPACTIFSYQTVLGCAVAPNTGGEYKPPELQHVATGGNPFTWIADDWSAAGQGAVSNLSVTAGAGWRIGPVGSSATLNNQLSDGLLGGTGQINVTTSPKSGFGLGGNYYAGLGGGFKSATPTAGTFTISAGAGVFARIGIGWGQGGLTSVQFTGGLGFGLSADLQLGANAPVLKVHVSPSGDQTNQVGPILPWD